MTLLKVENLNKNYGKHEVLKNLNFTLDEPGIKVLVGPNGSGKTTFFSLIANLIKPNSGSIEVVGKPNTDPDIFKKISILRDNRILYGYLSGLDHLNFIRQMQKLPKERMEEVIEQMQIGAYVKRPVKTYSMGMKQSLLLAMAMMNRPKLMILDEPLNGLDPTSVIRMRLLLQQIASNGTAILLSSHTLSEMDKLSNDFYFLKDRAIIQDTKYSDQSAEERYMKIFPEEMAKVERYFRL